MILVVNGQCQLMGGEREVVDELEHCLAAVYKKMIDAHGEEIANDTLATLGRRAVDLAEHWDEYFAEVEVGRK